MIQTFRLRQVVYTLDVSQYYAIGAQTEENFYYCINKALAKRDAALMGQLAGHVVFTENRCMLA